jgi:hypothetical protein
MLTRLNRIDARFLVLALMVGSPFLRADGGCGDSPCGKYAEAKASGRITASTCGKTGALEVSSPAKSCAVSAKLDAGMGLPTTGNRNVDSFRTPGWELSGRHDGSPLRCTVEQSSAALRFACKSEAGYNCTAELEITSGN